MTVGELIEVLSDYPDRAVVRFAYPARDYARSTLAREVTQVAPGDVEFSEYHDEYTLADEGDDDTEDAVILS